MIVEMLTVGPFQENCFLVGDPSTNLGIVIDPGDDADRIIEHAKATGLEFKYIWNTHAHLDHVCAVEALKEAFDIPFLLHQEDEILLRNLPKQAAMFGLEIDKIPVVDTYIQSTDTLEIGNLKAKVLHTPGHTLGGVTFYFDTEGIAFVGDSLFQGSIGRTDLYGGNFDTLIKSIRERLFTLPDNVTAYPGHGPPTTIGMEKTTNPFFSNHP